MIIIGFIAPAGTGKTTCCKALEPMMYERNLSPCRRSFADPIRAAIAALGIQKGGKQNALYRKMAQDIGDKLRSPAYVPGLTGPEYFVNLMSDELVRLRGEETDETAERVVLIDDIRYENEIAILQSAPARKTTIITLDPVHRLDADIGAEWRKHQSEQLASKILQGRCTPPGPILRAGGSENMMNVVLRSFLYDWTLGNANAFR